MPCPVCCWACPASGALSAADIAVWGSGLVGFCTAMRATTALSALRSLGPVAGLLCCAMGVLAPCTLCQSSKQRAPQCGSTACRHGPCQAEVALHDSSEALLHESCRASTKCKASMQQARSRSGVIAACLCLDGCQTRLGCPGGQQVWLRSPVELGSLHISAGSSANGDKPLQ